MQQYRETNKGASCAYAAKQVAECGGAGEIKKRERVCPPLVTCGKEESLVVSRINFLVFIV